MASSIPITIDIETYGLPVTQEELETFRGQWKPPGNVSKEETIEKKRQEAESRFLHTRALRPGENQVVAIGVQQAISIDTEVTVISGMDEERVLKDFIDCLMDMSHTKIRFCGFNIEAFDLPTLMFALYRHCLQLPQPLKIGKWDVVDLMRKPFGKQGKLKELSRRLGRGRVEDGSQVRELVEANKWDELNRYCAEDVRDTTALYLCATTIYNL